MATTTTYTGQLSNVDGSGNLSILNPATAGSVVSLTTSGMNSSLSSYNSVQKLANALQPISVTAPASMDLGSYLTGNSDSNVNTIANLASTVATINSNDHAGGKLVANNLTTSTSGTHVLDAYQGNVLNSNYETTDYSVGNLNAGFTNTGANLTARFRKWKDLVVAHGVILTGSNTVENLNQYIFHLPWNAFDSFEFVFAQNGSTNLFLGYSDRINVYTRTVFSPIAYYQFSFCYLAL